MSIWKQEKYDKIETKKHTHTLIKQIFLKSMENT